MSESRDPSDSVAIGRSATDVVETDMILVVPTYDYLSAPMIESLLGLKPDATRLVCLEFYQPRADFGELREIAGLSEKLRIFPRAPRPKLGELRRLRSELLQFLRDSKPQLIVTFSDVTLFARFVKGTEFETRLLIIQPCLLSSQSPGVMRRMIYFAGAVLNALLSMNVFRTTHYWGELLERATYLVWGAAETGSRTIRGRAFCSGSLFANLPMNAESQQATREVLVVVPDLPYYTPEEFRKLVAAYETLLRGHPERTFHFKFHPRNAQRLPLQGLANYAELSELSIAAAPHFELIVSSYTNLAVSLRCVHSKIVLFDLGWYAKAPTPYLSARFFAIANSAEELCRLFDDFISDKYMRCATEDYRAAMFAIEERSVHYLEQFFDREKLQARIAALQSPVREGSVVA